MNNPSSRDIRTNQAGATDNGYGTNSNIPPASGWDDPTYAQQQLNQQRIQQAAQGHPPRRPQSAGPRPTQGYQPAQNQTNNPVNASSGGSARIAPSSKYNELFCLKVHGKKHALNFAPDKTRKGFVTIRIEGADSVSNGSREYNWKDKIAIQVTRNEILDLIAVMLGYKKNCKYSNHGSPAAAGEQKTAKGFEAEHQGMHVYFKVFGDGKGAKSTPIPLQEAIQIGHMTLNLYLENHIGLSSDTVLDSLKRFAYFTSQQPQANSPS